MKLNRFLDGLVGKTLEEANRITEETCGIIDFFDTEDYTVAEDIEQNNKVEYGDWQTSFELAYQVCLLVKKQGITPNVIIEPTCGTGNFILASLMVFGTSVHDIYGIEIYKPYINKLKYKVLNYALSNPHAINCRIHLIHRSIFNFNFDDLYIDKNKNVLIIGNPPWVTNSKLCEINSSNLPEKTNFKSVKGLEAITGKANFDIAEYITYQLLDAFHSQNACLAFLIKNSVAKNIVYEQHKERYNIGSITQYNIDAKKEFDVSVAACIFVAKLGFGKAKQCTALDFYKMTNPITYGWVGNSFVSNVQDYSRYMYIDGKCQLTWWSGLKHDCAKVMELERKEGILFNSLGEKVDIENDLVYPILKSSDIKGTEISVFRKYVIVTQRSTSDDTSFIKESFPRTYNYLEEHSEWFSKRGSVIYKKRSKYCIFGIGQYSFKNYKIAIAGLYKSTTFSLVGPLENKCVMLDDTCYLLGFDHRETALVFLKVLNSPIVQQFMQSIVFFDAKRSINKDLLMRIDLEKAATMLYKEKYLSEVEYVKVISHINLLNKPTGNQLLFDI